MYKKFHIVHMPEAKITLIFLWKWVLWVGWYNGLDVSVLRRRFYDGPSS